MDLGIAGRTAIVCASSKGLGKGAALALAKAGVNLVMNARSEGPLHQAAAEIAETTGVKAIAVAADIKSEEGREAVMAAANGAPDILINNAGGPPPGDFADFDMQAWRDAVEGNMITPLALIKAVLPGMRERRFGRIVNITSASVKNPIAVLELSNGARAGLTGAVASLARKVAGDNVTINGALPGLHDTDRIAATLEARAEAQGISMEQAIADAGKAIPAGRLGNPEDFGAACAFLCSQQAGFITGQNLIIDGGAFNYTI
ncbi:MAG: SDR family oxidoreductase [Pseudomonadota bacterium]